MQRTWLVTGAGRGIGLELVRQLRSRGENVIATVRDDAQRGALEALGARVERLDVADAEGPDALAAALDGVAIDRLVNNAGVMGKRYGPEALDLDDLRRCFEINALGPLRVTSALLPNLRAGRDGLVAQMTSKMGSIEDNGSGGSYSYRASKAALNMLNKSLALDLADEGFRCVVLHPGWVQTDMGGASAPVSVEESAAGLLDVLEKLKPDDSGGFFDFRGERIPW